MSTFENETTITMSDIYNVIESMVLQQWQSTHHDNEHSRTVMDSEPTSDYSCRLLQVFGTPVSGKTEFAYQSFIHAWKMLQREFPHDTTRFPSLLVAHRTIADSLRHRLISDVHINTVQRPISTMNALAFRILTANMSRFSATIRQLAGGAYGDKFIIGDHSHTKSEHYTIRLLDGERYETIIRQELAEHVAHNHFERDDSCPICISLYQYFETQPSSQRSLADVLAPNMPSMSAYSFEQIQQALSSNFISELRHFFTRINELQLDNAQEYEQYCQRQHNTAEPEQMSEQDTHANAVLPSVPPRNAELQRIALYVEYVLQRLMGAREGSSFENRLLVEWRCALLLHYAVQNRIMKLGFQEEQKTLYLDSSQLASVAAQLIAEAQRNSIPLNAVPSFVVIDDVQDTTLAGVRFIEALHAYGVPIVAVGNNDESLQSFRGAYPEYVASTLSHLSGARSLILDNCADWKPAATVTRNQETYAHRVAARLSQKIGSLQPFLDSNGVEIPISQRPGKMHDNCEVVNAHDGSVIASLYSSVDEEIHDIIWQLREWYMQHHANERALPWNDCAIIAHDNATLQALGKALQHEHIPCRFSTVTQTLAQQEVVLGLCALVKLSYKIANDYELLFRHEHNAELEREQSAYVESDSAIGLDNSSENTVAASWQQTLLADSERQLQDTSYISLITAILQSSLCEIAYYRSNNQRIIKPLADSGIVHGATIRNVRLRTLSHVAQSIADMCRIVNAEYSQHSIDNVAQDSSAEGDISLENVWKTMIATLGSDNTLSGGDNNRTTDNVQNDLRQKPTLATIAAMVLADKYHDNNADLVQARRMIHIAVDIAQWIRQCYKQHKGVTPEEILWEAWNRCHIAEIWQMEALYNDERSVQINQRLDMIMRLFALAQSRSAVSTLDFIDNVEHSEIPADSLAHVAPQDHAVTLTTPAGVHGKTWKCVWIIDIQEGVWPNPQLRNLLFHTDILSEYYVHGNSLQHAAKQYSHDMELARRSDGRLSVLYAEYKMLLVALTRATEQVRMSAVWNDDTAPASLWNDIVNELLRMPNDNSAMVTLETLKPTKIGEPLQAQRFQHGVAQLETDVPSVTTEVDGENGALSNTMAACNSSEHDTDITHYGMNNSLVGLITLARRTVVELCASLMPELSENNDDKQQKDAMLARVIAEYQELADALYTLHCFAALDNNPNIANMILPERWFYRDTNARGKQEATDNNNTAESINTDSSTGQKTIRLSPSKLESAWSCPLKQAFESRYFGPQDNRYSLKFGTIIHAVAERATREGYNFSTENDDEERVAAIFKQLQQFYREEQEKYALQENLSQQETYKYVAASLEGGSLGTILSNLAQYFARSSAKSAPKSHSQEAILTHIIPELPITASPSIADIATLFYNNATVAQYYETALQTENNAEEEAVSGELSQQQIDDFLAILQILAGGWSAEVNDIITSKTFTITAKIDRLERYVYDNDGDSTHNERSAYSIIDYKTGQAHTSKEIFQNLQLFCYQLGLLYCDPSLGKAQAQAYKSAERIPEDGIGEHDVESLSVAGVRVERSMLFDVASGSSALKNTSYQPAFVQGGSVNDTFESRPRYKELTKTLFAVDPLPDRSETTLSETAYERAITLLECLSKRDLRSDESSRSQPTSDSTIEQRVEMLNRECLQGKIGSQMLWWLSMMARIFFGAGYLEAHEKKAKPIANDCKFCSYRAICPIKQESRTPFHVSASDIANIVQQANSNAEYAE